ncbi:hypothetical protein CPB86DRAFT_21827 [Serendipita vermifera]|nr:hypothetical protein CPB86DRAFT_21827 [Serendipita vermifera]
MNLTLVNPLTTMQECIVALPLRYHDSHNKLRIQIFFVTPLFLVYHIILSLVLYTLAGVLFQVLGDQVFALCGFEKFGDVLSSVILGGVGGAILAVPFAAFFALFMRNFDSATLTTASEEDPRVPLLSTPAGSQESPGTVQETRRPQPQIIEALPYEGLRSLPYSNQQAQSAAYTKVMGLGLMPPGLTLFSPVIGAFSGMIGSFVLSINQIPNVGFANAAKAGATGGLAPLLLIAFLLFVPTPDPDAIFLYDDNKHREREVRRPSRARPVQSQHNGRSSQWYGGTSHR